MPTVDLPYQELLGNYNFAEEFSIVLYDLPYQELLGNYNLVDKDTLEGM